jgi:hypothetical protein
VDEHTKLFHRYTALAVDALAPNCMQTSEAAALGSPGAQNVAPLLTAVPASGPARHVYGPVVAMASAASHASLPWLAAAA